MQCPHLHFKLNQVSYVITEYVYTGYTFCVKVMFAHTEDVGAHMVELACMVTMEISRDDGGVLEKWTDFVIPGTRWIYFTYLQSDEKIYI